MTQEDLEYFTERADRELDQAQRAIDPAASRAHYILANFYLNKLHGHSTEELRTV